MYHGNEDTKNKSTYLLSRYLDRMIDTQCHHEFQNSVDPYSISIYPPSAFAISRLQLLALVMCVMYR